VRDVAARPAARERGFTLVEVVVGALVLGIFVSFVYGAVVSAFRVRNVVQSTTSAMSRGTMAIEILARDIESAFSRPIEENEYFKAEEDGGRAVLDFLTTTDSRRQEEFDRRLLRSDVTEVGYRIRQGESGYTLYRREQFGVDDRPLEGGDYYKVIDGVKEFTIDWFEKDPSEEGGDEDRDAVTEWDSKEKKKLPRAGKIVLILDGKSSDPEKAEETVEFRFTRWVVLPGSHDKEPKAEAPPGGSPPGGNPPGGNPPGGN
jgi:prepilin-type N-terminal cleavage/methylation domain-containing protein